MKSPKQTTPDCNKCRVKRCETCMTGGCIITDQACELCEENKQNTIEYEDTITEIEECQKEKLDPTQNQNYHNPTNQTNYNPYR
ncbi:hypothetical protein [Methanonatronarchaeum sp. AMET-Sl]|uniref:hypothetical protein n=1 Tax=Methanonatronarchaeum sp. AMET-Sl TaxID=3037654 RepID=UPI00244DA27C|nr:hypothetical protein [Methanonatronarchaeum sp. AMET-Sl]WGI17706.1 hypothetical protein QEN48_01475 [Methanonatronarchaeum sp. AMET-Sl]